MSDTDSRRLKFYGTNDYATHLQGDRLTRVCSDIRNAASPLGVSDAIEIENACQFLEGALASPKQLPPSIGDPEEIVRAGRRMVGIYFSAINASNLNESISGVDWRYRGDLVRLLARHQVGRRTESGILIKHLMDEGVGLGDLLTNRPFVEQHDEELRRLLMLDPLNGAFYVRKFLMSESTSIEFPRSLTIGDQVRLLNDYIDAADAHPNYIELISVARSSKNGPITPTLKLKAKKAFQVWRDGFATDGNVLRLSYEVGIRPDQREPVDCDFASPEMKAFYSADWLLEGLDTPSILNNFVFLFQFVDPYSIWTLPAYESELGVLTRTFRLSGRDSYPTSMVFRSKESLNWMQTAAYRSFLLEQGIELEEVLLRYFEEILPDTLGLSGFRFSVSTPTSTYLERCRNLLIEMESLARQFSLLCTHSEIDRELLEIESDPISYQDIPSLASGKYLYVTKDSELERLLPYLFSDQSHLIYIDEQRQARSFVELLLQHKLTIADFEAYREPRVSELVDVGLIRQSGGILEFESPGQILALKQLYCHSEIVAESFPMEGQKSIKIMADRGWLSPKSTLLTNEEAKLMNYYLNQSQFSNGPDLRNKYMHGSNSLSEREHYSNYIKALMLIVTLTIKINDDIEIWISRGRA